MLLKGETRNLFLMNYPTAEKQHSSRIWELDFLRGLAIILMWIDHFMFDLTVIFGKVWTQKGGATAAVAKFAEMWWDGGASWIGETHDIVRVITLCVFFGLCGGSTIFSRDNSTRAVKTMIAASIITLGTSLAASLEIIDATNIIIFGVLHMLSFVTIIVSGIYGLTRLAKKRQDVLFCIVSAILAGLVFLVNYLLGEKSSHVNATFMWVHESFVTDALMGGDYFPIIPYLGYAFAGAAIITFFYAGGKSILPKLDGAWNHPFRFAGRHTLLIVIIHQVVNMLILAVVTALFVDKGNFVIF